MTATVQPPWRPTVVDTSTPESHADQERHAAVRRAAALVADGRPGKALYVMVRSVERQARILGGGTVEIHPGCPCGGRCPKGGAR